MSTNCMVGRYTDKARTHFQARYCHWDGYPGGVGNTLLRNWREVYQGDTQRLTDFLLSPKTGWSVLASTDFRHPPSWLNGHDAPVWYDDREGENPSDWPVLERSNYRQWSGLEYAYLFDIPQARLYVFAVGITGDLRPIGEASPETEDLTELEGA